MATGPTWLPHRVNMSFMLMDKRCGEQDVVGLKEFWVEPQNKGLGRKALQMVEAIAEGKIVVGFADKKSLRFYEKCGWFVGSDFSGKTLVASEPIDDTQHGGEIW